MNRTISAEVQIKEGEDEVEWRLPDRQLTGVAPDLESAIKRAGIAAAVPENWLPAEWLDAGGKS